MANEGLNEIQINLPNGLHDAEINSISLNYVERTIIFDLMLWVGDLESRDETSVKPMPTEF